MEKASTLHHSYLFQRQQHELLCLGNLHKVLQDILVCGLEQVAAGVRVSEASDAQAVGGVQLAEEELTAGVPHPVELQQACCWEQRLECNYRWKHTEFVCTLINEVKLKVFFHILVYKSKIFYLTCTFPSPTTISAV